MSTILDFWTPNFKATVIFTFVFHLLWKFTKWLKTCWKNIMCSFVEFLRAVLKLRLTKSCATFFGPPNIYKYKMEIASVIIIFFSWKPPIVWGLQSWYYCHKCFYVLFRILKYRIKLSNLQHCDILEKLHTHTKQWWNLSKIFYLQMALAKMTLPEITPNYLLFNFFNVNFYLLL